MASAASSRFRRVVGILFKTGLYATVLGIIALVVAVGVAMSSLPSYQELVRRDDLGQMIRVRAATARSC
jgi:penicillin-binding protein 1A